MQLDNYKNLKKAQNVCDLGKCRNDFIWSHCQIEGKKLETSVIPTIFFYLKQLKG